jgi:hypothetical protein
MLFVINIYHDLSIHCTIIIVLDRSMKSKFLWITLTFDHIKDG